jgi:hypothetical protein
MPVEIKELVIRAVTRSVESPSDEEQEETEAGDQTEPRQPVELSSKDEIVEAAVKEVMRILRTSRER